MSNQITCSIQIHTSRKISLDKETKNGDEELFVLSFLPYVLLLLLFIDIAAFSLLKDLYKYRARFLRVFSFFEDRSSFHFHCQAGRCDLARTVVAPCFAVKPHWMDECLLMVHCKNKK